LTLQFFYDPVVRYFYIEGILLMNKTIRDQADIIVQRATEKDAELIADLSRQTFYESFAADNTKENMDKFMNDQFTKEKLIDEVGQPWHLFFLAYMKNEPVGYVKLRDGSVPLQLDSRSCLEIARIYSVEHMIGKGVGKKLMQTCHDIARQKGKKILWLGVWKQNQRAIDFYSAWGFEIFGEQEFVLGDDVQTDWLMKKVLE
jgi:ribosomal protein S18 acetylase RimI-like enzyme